MVKNKIRVKSKYEYVIEVNDNGDTISIDPSDTELMLKFDRALKMIDEIQKKTKRKEEEIEEREDVDTDSPITKKEIAINKIWNEAFLEMRVAFDSFLGDGACQKIFGDKNYINMFEDLIEQLEPHFKKMGLNAQKLKDEIVEKYKTKDEKVL